MKILHILQSNCFSGAENVVCQIINMFKDDADIKMVYCSRNGQIAEALAERNVDFVPVKSFSVNEIKRVIAEQKPDIIHAHDMRASFYASLTCGDIPLVSHIHNNAFDSRGISAKSFAYLYAAKKAKNIIWVSQSAYEGYAFHKFFAKKSTVLYNIIDIDGLYEKMKGDDNSYSYDVMYVGRLTYQKNPQRLMNVFKILKEKKPNFKAAIVGKGDLEDETKALAKEYGLLDNIEFLGFMSNPLKIMYDSKVMVMTSRWEGTPMCALEAMALGLPIVSTAVDGLADLVENGKSGYLCDNDESLAERIYDIITDEALHTKLSEYIKTKAYAINNKEEYKKSLLKAYRC